MQTCLLVEEQHLPIPLAITELHSFGEGNLTISEEGSTSATIHMGRILVLEGEPQDFHEWLSSVGGMWSTLDHEVGNWDFIEADKLNGGQNG
jgi:hypothetical protein